MELNCVTAAAPGCGHWIQQVCGLNADKRPGYDVRKEKGNEYEKGQKNVWFW